MSKAFAAVGLLILVDRAAVGLDDRVADHWPEFAFGGKDGATVRHVLAHQAGLPAFPVPRAFDDVSDWETLTGDLAAAAPEWPPGTAHGEHALTYGHLVGELVRRIDGRMLGQFLRDEIARPWRLDLALGLDAEQQQRAAELEYADPGWVRQMLGAPGSLRQRALGNPAGCLDVAALNGARWRSALMPAVNVHASAQACARLYMGLLAGGELNGVRLLSKAAVAEMTRVQAEGPDRLLDRHASWGLGVQVEPSGEWGMGGIGGCDAFADPGRGYAYAYVTRRLNDHQRSTALIDALNDCLK